ncbi:MAG: hypothetical protein K0Q60_3581 [Microvirga sp.]|nr:hypothetical protein [Microvirga sp.]
MPDEGVALHVAAADDLHLLEDEGAALAEHHVALAELLLELHRPDLPAGKRDVGHLLGDAEGAGDAAAFRGRVVARHALHHRIVEPINGELVVRGERPPDR